MTTSSSFPPSVDPQDVQFLAAGMKSLRKATDLKAFISEVVRMAASIAGTNMASLYLLDREGGELRPYVTVNLPAVYTAGCAAVPLGTQCCGRAALHKVPWVVSDMWEDPLFADAREAAQQAGVRAAFSVPLLDGEDECLGTLAVHFREPYEPPQHAIERNQLFARLLTAAVQRLPQNGAGAAPSPAEARSK